MEWLLSDNHIIHWGSTVENSANSENKILGDLKQYLAKNNLYIGSSTFTSGFILVLVGACRRGYINIVQYVLHHHKGEFDINQVILCYIFDLLLDNSICPPNLRIDFLLLVASYSFFRFTENKIISPHHCWDLFQYALILRARLKLPPPNLSEAIEAYGGLTEVTSIEEFEERYSDFTNTSIQVKLAYQCLIIRERCVGYGDNSQINCLISYGEWMIYINYYGEGLLLWLRATEMLLYRLTKDSVMARCKLQFLLNKFIKSCAELYIDPLLKAERKTTPPNVDCQDLFVTIIGNLIECQHLSSERYKRCHVHHYSRLYEDAYHNFLTLLYHLSQSRLQRDDLHSLGCKAVAKCFRFITSSGWPSNLMTLAIKSYHYTDEAISFLALLLEWGGHELINEVAHNGSRPLGLVSSKKVARLLVRNGAHIDAAGINNHHLDDFFLTPLPLFCLSAKCVVANAIPYRSISLPCHIIDFIALHDPADISLKVQFMN